MLSTDPANPSTGFSFTVKTIYTNDDSNSPYEIDEYELIYCELKEPGKTFQVDTLAVNVGQEDDMVITWTLEEAFDPSDSYISLTLPKSNILYMDLMNKYTAADSPLCVDDGGEYKYC